MLFPKAVAAQRLQNLLLLTTLVAVVLAGFLISDLVQSFRGAVEADAAKSLTSAVRELAQAEQGWHKSLSRTPSSGPSLDSALQTVSYEVLRSYPDVEGGFLLNGVVVGHSFPTYTEPGSGLRQPPGERQLVLEAVQESQRTHAVVRRVWVDGRDLVVASALVLPQRPLAVWSLKRYLDFDDPRHLRRQLVLVGLLTVALGSILGTLLLSFRLQRGFAVIQTGLTRLRTEPSYRLPEQDHELQPIVAAINRMAAGREQLESDLRREDRLRMMGRIVAGVAHEIRNPLNSLRLSVQVLARRLRGQPSVEETVPLVVAEVDRLDALLKSLLVFNADERGRLRRQPVRPVVERAVALVRAQAEERGIRVQVDATDDAEAIVDGDHLQQALLNLLLNAIDAAGPQGRVSLTLQAAGGNVSIDVQDTGPGLPVEERDRLFEAFYTTKPTGSGLGLAVTRTLLEKMGASVEYVASDHVGGHFRVLLPAVQVAHAG